MTHITCDNKRCEFRLNGKCSCLSIILKRNSRYARQMVCQNMMDKNRRNINDKKRE